MIDFTKRSYEPELMDDLSCDGEVLKQTLAELKTINRLLGGNNVTTDGLKKLLKNHSSGTIRIADVGCGGGDMLQVMQTWGNHTGLDLEFLGIDANHHTIQLAKEKFYGNPRISFEVENVLSESFHRTPIDIVTCTLFTHHFTDKELKQMFSSFIKKAKVGVVVNDLHRNPVAYYSIKYLTKYFSKSPMVIHDAPLSVQRSFTRRELYGLLDGLGFKKIEISWHWAFRWQVVCWV
ncbi:methyltransferase domain-containing protein [Lunatibacter salilacus]|uniref:methyltransferase domain-containing protein n=1 Tax=Lunatibacter salilacus TaxID=2483804 RepID=UPI00131CB631|nr:methyltransferase domain-containing protein [Lunatibacter salilacus]